MSTEYHDSLVRFVIEQIYDSRMTNIENILSESADFGRIAHEANERFFEPHVRSLSRCMDHRGHITAEDVQLIFQRFKDSQQKAKEKFIAEHVKTPRRK